MEGKMMKAVCAKGDGTVEVVEVPATDISGDYECLVRITACGLCSGTDIKIITYGWAGEQKVQYPALIGHEGVGVIEKVGSKVRNWKVGDRVTCPMGMPVEGYDWKWGGMNGYGITLDVEAIKEDGVEDEYPMVKGMDPVDFLTKRIPEGMSDPDAVMILTLKENYSALKNFGVTKGSRVLIFGDGAVALGLTTFAKCLGAEWVGNIGHHDDRLARIQKLAKADLIVNSHTEDVEAAIGDRKFDVVVDAVGSIENILQGAKYLVPGGLVGIYGVLKKGHAMQDLQELPNNVRIQMLNWPYREHRQHEEMLALIKDGKVDPKEFYSHVMPVEEAQKGLEMILKREAYKVIFTYE